MKQPTIMTNIKQNRRQQPGKPGFTITETLLSLTLFMVIMAGVYMLIVHYASASRTEHSRQRLNQEVRFMTTIYAGELKDVGTVFTIIHTGSYLKALPNFNGITPLNQINYPDGIILATGDPEAVAILDVDFTPGNTTITVQGADKKQNGLLVLAYDSSKPDYENEHLDWRAGDVGVVVNTDGYYIFKVTEVNLGANQLSIRETPVYYSGLLDTNTGISVTHHFVDQVNGGGNTGNNITYTAGCPMFRVANFSIYLIHETEEMVAGQPIITRQLLRITDTLGEADVLLETSQSTKSVISENIWDMQISYVAYTESDFPNANRHTIPDPAHHYFAGGITNTDINALLTDIRSRNLKQIDVAFVSITDRFGGKGEKRFQDEYKVMGLFDEPSYFLPVRKYSFQVSTFMVEPRNFNIIY